MSMLFRQLSLFLPINPARGNSVCCLEPLSYYSVQVSLKNGDLSKRASTPLLQGSISIDLTENPEPALEDEITDL